MTRKAISIFSCSVLGGKPAWRVIAAAARGRVRAPSRRTGKRRPIFFAAELFDLVEDRTKDVRLVVRDDSGKIREAFRALNDGSRALETHAGIDVALRQW